jgi:hypothetical protein
MSDLLMFDGVKLMLLLPMEADHVPVTVQVLDITSQASRVDITVSDGSHCCQLMLAKHLHDLVTCGDVKRGMLVLLKNYITQSLSDKKSVVICLDLSIVGLHDSIIGSPSEFRPPSLKVIEKIEFVGISCDGVVWPYNCAVCSCYTW